MAIIHHTQALEKHLAEIYQADVSKDLISRVTDKVVDELTNWQNRPLDRVYPVVLIDAIRDCLNLCRWGGDPTG